MSLLLLAASSGNFPETLFDAATKVTSHFALGAFSIAAVVAIIWMIAKKTGRANRVPAMAWVVLLAAILIPTAAGVIIALVPTGTYRVTVVVEDPGGGVVPDARVTSSVGGQEKSTNNAVEYEIPATSLPSGHKVTFFADKDGAVGQQSVKLSSNRSASVTVRLGDKLRANALPPPLRDSGQVTNPVDRSKKERSLPKGSASVGQKRTQTTIAPQAAPPATVNNCPNGICISGGVVDHPTVNNFGPDQAPITLHYSQSGNTVTVSTSGRIDSTSLALIFDSDVSFIADSIGSCMSCGTGNLRNSEGIPDNKTIWIYWKSPSFTPDEPLSVTFSSGAPAKLLRVVRGPQPPK